MRRTSSWSPRSCLVTVVSPDGSECVYQYSLTNGYDICVSYSRGHFTNSRIEFLGVTTGSRLRSGLPLRQSEPYVVLEARRRTETLGRVCPSKP